MDFRTDTTEIAACLFIMGACLGKCLGKDVGDRGQPLGGGGGVYRPTGGGEDAPDRDAVRQNALAAAERRAEENAKRGVQGNKPTLSPSKPAPAAGGRNEVNYSDAKTWN